MPERTIEDRLRGEYFDYLPEIRRVARQIETQVRYLTLPTSQSLAHYEQLIVESRIKDCESAVKSLRQRQEGGTFDPERPDDYSVLSLPDLAGVRVLVFPRGRLDEVDHALRTSFPDWASDPVLSRGETVLARTYSGYCLDVSGKVRAEYQVVPMLIGLFWKVEHEAIYKPPLLKGKADSEPMQMLRKDVEDVLLRFETEFESLIRDSA